MGSSKEIGTTSQKMKGRPPVPATDQGPRPFACVLQLGLAAAAAAFCLSARFWVVGQRRLEARTSQQALSRSPTCPG